MRKFLFGVSLVISGFLLAVKAEEFIPEQYTINLTQGCITRRDSPGIVLLPKTEMYSYDFNAVLPVVNPNSNIRNYQLALDIVTGIYTKLPSPECDLVYDLINNRMPQ